jgi:hypothetical protein
LSELILTSQPIRKSLGMALELRKGKPTLAHDENRELKRRL